MDKLTAMKVFITVYEQASFVAASQKLDISAPAVTRAIATLEHHLKTPLFVRSTRHVRATDAGAIYYQQASRIIDDIEMAEDLVSGVQQVARGTLHLTAPVMFGKLHIAPIVAEFMSLHTNVSVNAMFYDQVINLMQEHLEVAIRIGHLDDSNLYAIKVGNVRRVTCASPDYLSEYGEPHDLDALEQHQIISASGNEALVTWTFEEQRKIKTVKLKPKFSCNQIDLALVMAKRGKGIMQRLSYQVNNAIEQQQLVPILQDYATSSLPVHVVHLEGRKASIKTRAFIDLAVERLRSNPALEHS